MDYYSEQDAKEYNKFILKFIKNTNEIREEFNIKVLNKKEGVSKMKKGKIIISIILFIFNSSTCSNNAFKISLFCSFKNISVYS